MNQSVGPRSSANPSPVRRSGSIRRTTSIDVSWAEGITGPRSFDGRARDIVRRDDGRDVVAAEAQMNAEITFDRMIAAMSATPAPEGIIRHCEGKMSYFAIPRYVEFVADLPKTANGKVQ